MPVCIVSPLVVVWLLLLGNTAGMDQKDSITMVLAVAYASLGLLVSLLALIFLRRCQALMPCIMAGMDSALIASTVDTFMASVYVALVFHTFST